MSEKSEKDEILKQKAFVFREIEGGGQMGTVDPEMSDWRCLLEELVAARGGQAEVASRLCKITRRSSERDFETAKRNLANWTAGSTLPQRRNLAALSQALRVEEEPQLLARWNALYSKARDAEVPVQESDGPATPSKRAFRQRALQWPIMSAAAAVIAAAMVLGYWALGSAAGEDERTIGYLPFAELKVGESVLVHAKRGECGQAPPEWYQIEHEIPALQTGRLVDDGLGTSRSTTCGGLTPGRLVRFVAERPGDETFELFQRKIRVLVHE